MSTNQTNEKIQKRLQTESMEEHARQKLISIARTKRITADFADRVPKSLALETMPLYQPDQCWILFNVGGPRKKLVASKNCIRLLGFFATPDAASTAAKTHVDYGSIDFFVHLTGKYRLVSTTIHLNEQSELSEIHQIYGDHVTQLRNELNQFERYCDRDLDKEAVSGPDTVQDAETAPDTDTVQDAETVSADTSMFDCLLSSCTGLMTTDQAYGVITVITGSNDSHIVAMHAAHSTESDSIRYAKDILSDHVVNVTSTVVSMCKWIFLDHLQDPNIRRGYRHVVLNNVMQYKKNLPDQIKAYKAQCDEAGMPPKITDVTGHAADVGRPAVEWSNGVTPDNAIDDATELSDPITDGATKDVS